ncbi:GntR family transcriptional regulator [Cellulomonas sp. KRMCY2]|uniref:GntR family transcriptional regulator n=1 Tax=Cellulomonas sp. KRMCY2 TaxID=1304865 RepID=UPI00045E976C|nr:GntR family transcriptional regulator [Cellulomonas sp. KRMCY2]
MSSSDDVLLARLRAMVARQDMRPGDRLGDERSLAVALGVPRTQLRRALERLEGDGTIRRTIGRAGGVVVADGRVERNLNTVEGLPDIARYQGVHLETRLLRVELTGAGAREQRLLQLPDGAAVHRIIRLRFADGRPLSLETSELPADLFPGLGTQDLRSLYRTLHAVYDVTPVYSDETLELAVADAVQGDHLQVAPGTPLIHIRRTATCSTGRPIEIADELFVGDRMRFHLRKYGHVRSDRHELTSAPDELTSAHHGGHE